MQREDHNSGINQPRLDLDEPYESDEYEVNT